VNGLEPITNRAETGKAAWSHPNSINRDQRRSTHINRSQLTRRPIRYGTSALGLASDISGRKTLAGWTEQTVGVGQAESFEWSRRKNGDVVISHHGRVATTLRGRRADQFVEDVVDEDGQELMARLTGNYKRGNERDPQRHPRNRGRR